jgi:hypothetical protein
MTGNNSTDRSKLGTKRHILTDKKGIPHRFVVGNKGGHALVISPPELEFYFFKVSELLEKGEVSYITESNIGEQYGQVFLDSIKHWK